MAYLPHSTFHCLNSSGSVFRFPHPNPDLFSIHCSLLSITHTIAGKGESPINPSKFKLPLRLLSSTLRVLAIMWFTSLCPSSKLLFNPFLYILSWFTIRGHNSLLLFLLWGPLRVFVIAFLPTRTPNLHNTHAWISSEFLTKDT